MSPPVCLAGVLATWHALHRETGTPWRLAAPADATGLINHIYCTAPPTGTNPIDRLLTTTYTDWHTSLAQQEAAAAERAVIPYPSREPCDIDDLASGPAYGDADDTQHPLHLIARCSPLPRTPGDEQLVHTRAPSTHHPTRTAHCVLRRW
ncbi:hypothetical protein ACFU99_02155 [Streptomyces sp. NPDC057654]|uniref:hypothetical protein n=1 Tax=Streptomyces sp. NPDC057654 TaxID=3346196 RepID=UPI003687BD2B